MVNVRFYFSGVFYATMDATDIPDTWLDPLGAQVESLYEYIAEKLFWDKHHMLCALINHTDSDDGVQAVVHVVLW